MSRIITLQRNARELGRLRMGEYGVDPAKPSGKARPRRSDTWIITSHSEEYVTAAAAEWGGEIERWTPQGTEVAQWRVKTETNSLDAILPPGDPLRQYYEKWNRGGCERRCDGETESLSDQPCLCRAKFGDQFHERTPKDVCQITSRLSLILPQMPDIGVWRMETHSYYAATELATHVDLIREAVSDSYAMPIRLRIEARDRMVKGEARHYSVPVVELRGVVAGQILSGHLPQQQQISSAASERPALEAAPELPGAETRKHTSAQWQSLIALCRNQEQLRSLWADVEADGLAGDANLIAAFSSRSRALKEPRQEPDPSSNVRAAAPKTKAQLDRLWTEIVSSSPFDSMKELEDDFWGRVGKAPQDADAHQLEGYLRELKGDAS